MFRNKQNNRRTPNVTSQTVEKVLFIIQLFTNKVEDYISKIMYALSGILVLVCQTVFVQ